MTAALEGGEWSAARPGRTLSPGKTGYPLYRMLGIPQGRPGRAENLVPTGIRSRIVQPVISRYTDWTTRPTEVICTNIYSYIYNVQYHINLDLTYNSRNPMYPHLPTFITHTRSRDHFTSPVLYWCVQPIITPYNCLLSISCRTWRWPLSSAETYSLPYVVNTGYTLSIKVVLDKYIHSTLGSTLKRMLRNDVLSPVLIHLKQGLSISILTMHLFCTKTTRAGWPTDELCCLQLSALPPPFPPGHIGRTVDCAAV